MLLSFWDTYWDDSIIEENSDVRTNLSKSYIDFPVEAPGVAPEPFSIAYADDETYYQNIFNTQEQYFQFLLMSMGNDLYGIEQGDYGLASSNMLALFKHYLFEYRNFSKNDVEITSTSLNVRNKAIRLIIAPKANQNPTDFQSVGLRVSPLFAYIHAPARLTSSGTWNK